MMIYEKPQRAPPARCTVPYGVRVVDPPALYSRHPQVAARAKAQSHTSRVALFWVRLPVGLWLGLSQGQQGFWILWRCLREPT